MSGVTMSGPRCPGGLPAETRAIEREARADGVHRHVQQQRSDGRLGTR
jgi:hypothetical protein